MGLSEAGFRNARGSISASAVLALSMLCGCGAAGGGRPETLTTPTVYQGPCQCDPGQNMPSAGTTDGGVAIYGSNPLCPPVATTPGIPENASCCQAGSTGVYGCGVSPCSDCATYGIEGSVCDTDPSADRPEGEPATGCRCVCPTTAPVECTNPQTSDPECGVCVDGEGYCYGPFTSDDPCCTAPGHTLVAVPPSPTGGYLCCHNGVIYDNTPPPDGPIPTCCMDGTEPSHDSNGNEVCCATDHLASDGSCCAYPVDGEGQCCQTQIGNPAACCDGTAYPTSASPSDQQCCPTNSGYQVSSDGQRCCESSDTCCLNPSSCPDMGPDLSPPPDLAGADLSNPPADLSNPPPADLSNPPPADLSNPPPADLSGVSDLGSTDLAGADLGSSDLGGSDLGTCTPTTSCGAEGADCDSIWNGCEWQYCGTCVDPETCGGGGTPNVCGTPPQDLGGSHDLGGSQDLSASQDLGGGGINDLSVGDQGSGGGDMLGCTPITSCASSGAECDFIWDGCDWEYCGTCTSPETCGGGGVANVCGTPPSDGGTLDAMLADGGAI